MARHVIQPTASEMRAHSRRRTSASSRLLQSPVAQLLADEIDALEARIVQANNDLRWLKGELAKKRDALLDLSWSSSS